MIVPDDDRLHPRSDDPYWTETGWFSIAVPERKLNGAIYFYHRPNMRLSAGGPILWDPSGEEIYNCLYWDWDTSQAFPDGAEMFDFTLDNGLSVTPIELLQSYRVGYKGHGCEIDLHWDAIMEPNEMERVGGEVNPSVSGFWSDEGAGTVPTGHYEQAGRIRGSIAVEGETIEVDCFSLRDRTWSPRRPRQLRLAYDWAVASERSSFFAPSAAGLPSDQDPVIGTVENVTAGWYMKDGVRAALVSGERRVVERGDDGHSQRVVIDATDALGRRLQAAGRRINLLRWTGYNDWIDHFGLAEWEYDGEAAWGEIQEYFQFRLNRRLHRTLSRSR